MLKTLTGEQIEDTAEHLATRVQHRSPNVKLKALRCVKWLCQRGNEPRFRRAMTKRSGPVRTCVSHTGRPDPQRGDAPHKAVRDMAKETLEALFANDGSGGGGGGRMEGFGSDAAAHTGAPHASHDASVDGNEQLGSWGGVAEPTNGFGGDEATAIIGDGPARLNKISGTWGAPEPPRAPPPAPTPSPPPAVPPAAATSNPSPAPAQAPAMRLASRDIWGQPAQQPTRQPAQQPAHPPSPPLSPVAAGANAPFTLEGSEEQRRVDALCAGGGVKLAPAVDAMDAFAGACGGLRPEGVAAALAHKIRRGEWREGYRAACVLEHVAKGGGCEAVVRAFASAEADSLDAAAAGGAGSHELLRAKAGEAKAAVAASQGGVANPSTTNGPC